MFTLLILQLEQTVCRKVHFALMNWSKITMKVSLILEMTFKFLP